MSDLIPISTINSEAPRRQQRANGRHRQREQLSYSMTSTARGTASAAGPTEGLAISHLLQERFFPACAARRRASHERCAHRSTAGGCLRGQPSTVKQARNTDQPFRAHLSVEKYRALVGRSGVRSADTSETRTPPDFKTLYERSRVSPPTVSSTRSTGRTAFWNLLVR
jgi:hypothetical protein